MKYFVLYNSGLWTGIGVIYQSVYLSQLRSPHPPNINCTDTFGNTALHNAAYCRQRAAAALLLENGVNTSIKNNKGVVLWLPHFLCCKNYLSSINATDFTNRYISNISIASYIQDQSVHRHIHTLQNVHGIIRNH